MSLSASDIERIARDWQSAYAEANDSIAPAITWSRGWFYIGTIKSKYRRAAIEEMTKTLRARQAEQRAKSE